ncbi:hypothetical protein [Erythrobacter sp. WG]|uniref:hypothetical protein n=1 Tax=Erythrobacter sp. WG TaxID=2985510 RepID=UPI00227164C7|nr:hypothetical protein [Erythrobacter sp. WG]
MSDIFSSTSPSDPPGGGRRRAERRQASAPCEGAERRDVERRSGRDRRAAPRSDGLG